MPGLNDSIQKNDEERAKTARKIEKLKDKNRKLKEARKSGGRLSHKSRAAQSFTPFDLLTTSETDSDDTSSSTSEHGDDPAITEPFDLDSGGCDLSDSAQLSPAAASTRKSPQQSLDRFRSRGESIFDPRPLSPESRVAFETYGLDAGLDIEKFWTPENMAWAEKFYEDAERNFPLPTAPPDASA